MLPENSQPAAMGPEQFPMPPSLPGEHIPSLPPLDTGIEKGADRREQAAEAGARAADAATFAAPVAVPPVPPPIVPVNDVVQNAASATPLVAADEDLIEKEWVDKAKEIILQTRDDPHARTQKVNELQRDYLQKRYNRVMGASE